MAPRALAIYDDFSGGEWGTLGPKKAAKNQFSAVNAMVYADGQIGPRPGLKKYSNVVIPRGVQALGMIDGELIIYGYLLTAPERLMGVALDHSGIANFVGAEYTAGVPARTDTTITGFFQESGGTGVEQRRSFIGGSSNATNTIYRYNHSTRNISDRLTTPAYMGLAICRYGERMMASGVGANGTVQNRLYYSAAADFTSWPALNFIDVGDVDILSLFVLRNRLVIVTAGEGIWVLTGVPGVNETLREVIPKQPPFNRLGQGLGGIGAVSELTNLLLSGTYRGQYVPAVFDGSQRTVQSTLATGWLGDVPATGFRDQYPMVVALDQRDDGLWLGRTGPFGEVSGGEQHAILHRHGVWSRHLFGVAGQKMVHFQNGRVGVTDNTNLYSFTAAWDKVPIVGENDGFLSVGDNSSVPLDNVDVDLSEFWDPDGREMTVRSVVVDVTMYDINAGGGSDTTNRLRCAVRGVGRFDTVDEDTATQTQDTGGNLGGSDGVHRSLRFSFEPIQCRGFQVMLHGLRALSVRRVTVFGDRDDVRP